MKRTDGYLRGISILLFAVLGAIAVLWAGVSLSGWPAPDLLGKERCEVLPADWAQVLPDGSRKDVEIPGTFEVDEHSTAVIEAALPFMCYLDEVQKRRYHRLYIIMEAVAVAASAACFLLHMTGILPYIYSIPVVVIEIASGIIAVFVTVIQDIRRKALDYPLIAAGMGVFFLTGLISIPDYMQGAGNMNKNLVLIGLLALAIVAVLRAVLDAEKAKQEKKEALALSDSKSRFLASMSHEIRTPINTVLGMNEMIERECTDEGILKYSENIDTAGRMLLSIINDILDFSKIESGKMELTEVPY